MGYRALRRNEDWGAMRFTYTKYHLRLDLTANAPKQYVGGGTAAMDGLNNIKLSSCHDWNGHDAEYR